MKNILYITILLLTVSCNKILDRDPEDFLSPKNYYQTDKQLQTALNGVYSTLASQSLYCNNMLARMGLETDEGFCSNETELRGVAGYNTSTVDGKVKSFYQTLYSGINRANLLLENLEITDSVEQVKRVEIRGEALFLRGYFYFMLVSNFGEVPLITQSIQSASTSELQVEQASLKQIYESITADMEEAQRLLPDMGEVKFGGRVTKSAAWGILGRVYLHMAGEPLKDISKYEKASYWLNKVITSGLHELNDNYEQIFINYAQDKYDPKESIFEVEFWGNGMSTYTIGGMVGRNNGIRMNSGGAPSIGYSPGYLHPTENFYNYFQAENPYYSNDQRRDWTIAEFYYRDNNKADTVHFLPTQIYERYCGKFRRVNELLLPKGEVRTPQNFPILRYADVLLMYAEAENRRFGPDGSDTDIIAMVNDVRRRGYGKYMNGKSSVSESIKTITVTNPGSGYTAKPNVIISGDGIRAKAEAIISGGQVQTIRILNGGIKFSSAPTITITGGGGSGATAAATLTARIDADLSADDISSTDKFHTAIMKERSRELGFELLRKSDLVRWGKFMENMDIIQAQINVAPDYANQKNAKVAYNSYSERDVRWPIPSDEMAVNPKLKQNKGW